MYKIGWFSTGGGGAARALLKVACQAIKTGEIPDSQIAYVFCNQEPGESAEGDKFLSLVKELRIPLVCCSSTKFLPALRKGSIYNWRICYYGYARDLLKEFNEDIRMLAGFMLILDAETCFQKLAINLHPALPGGPKGTWQEVIRRIMKNKDKESGAMMHLAIPELDSGPALTFCRYEIEEYDFNKIRQQGLKREFPLIIETLRLLATGKIKLQSKKRKPRDLTKIVEKTIRSCQ